MHLRRIGPADLHADDLLCFVILLLFPVTLQAGITAMHLGRIHLESGWLSVLVAFQCVLLWFRLNYFSR
jgi:hypothetical protein